MKAKEYKIMETVKFLKPSLLSLYEKNSKQYTEPGYVKRSM